MQTRFLLGPAGSGKTFRCLAEIRRALLASPVGPPLVFLAPKQATFQLERQLLADPSLPGYARLHILSFERLAQFILAQGQNCEAEILNEEGRVMVLRAVLARKRHELRLFRATARLRGFAQQLSQLLGEFHRFQVTPDQLTALAAQIHPADPLALKLQDLVSLWRAYLDWLEDHRLQDADRLLSLATGALSEPNPKSDLPVAGGPLSLETLTSRLGRIEDREQQTGENSALRTPHSALDLAGLWLDGFADLSPQEMELLCAVLPCCHQATLAFNLDRATLGGISWLSPWSLVTHTVRRLRERLASVPGLEVIEDWLQREAPRSRFANNPALEHLEKHWAQPIPFPGGIRSLSAVPAQAGTSYLISSAKNAVASRRDSTPENQEGVVTHHASFINLGSDSSPENEGDAASAPSPLAESLRLVACPNPESEAILAAREILRFVRAGGRFREIAVIVRDLERYHDAVRRVFLSYEIPFFMDRREPVGHHPLAELTRSAVRTVAFHWQNEDWFGALKTGLVPAEEAALDRLENEALAHGWQGKAWHQPLNVPDEPDLSLWLEGLRRQLLPPFQNLALALGSAPSGRQLAEALRQFWEHLKIGDQLQDWTVATTKPLHASFWQQMQEWLDNLALAFAHESLPLREWLPILDAGLAGQTVGIIPPALDQVLIGAIDRSRNPDLQMALLLGLNESVFPATPLAPNLLTESDREEMAQFGVRLEAGTPTALGREQYYGYIACTRPRQRLVLTHSLRDQNDQVLNPSPFLAHLQRLFPSLREETFAAAPPWLESEHASELVAPLVRQQSALGPQSDELASLLALPAFTALRGRLEHFRSAEAAERLAPALAEQLYGATLRTSVSRLEQHAACPFQFFVRSGLQAEERTLFELDVREQGTFQHEVLARFHGQVRHENKNWRDLTPAEARARIGQIAGQLIPAYREGLLLATDQSRLTARSLQESLQDFIEAIVDWMRQYEFDPCAVELAFGLENAALPAWEIDLGQGHALSFRGQIDRVDLWKQAGGGEGLCVVIDYKSSGKKLDPILCEHGVQLQLPAYLNVLRDLKDPRPVFGVERLVPAGVFYVNLRGAYQNAATRVEALAARQQARRRAYQHAGRFDGQFLRRLDNRPEAMEGDQFKYRLKQDGEPYLRGTDFLDAESFAAMLDKVEVNLRRMGQEIFAGAVKVDPYRKGSLLACDQCDFRAVCRIDPWTHEYRVLRKTDEGNAAPHAGLENLESPSKPPESSAQARLSPG
ncbi:MAG: PD-(D/E)XK nuclease family protein [Chloroflexi bacterium]|nr:PD-(D/E)XK nuclease family protein [Chloroflexota bacterium]